MMTERLFKLKEHGTNVRTEVLAGITTFMTMACFLTIIMMPFAYSIAEGISFGIVSYVLLKSLAGQFKDISWLMVVLALLFILKIALM